MTDDRTARVCPACSTLAGHNVECDAYKPPPCDESNCYCDNPYKCGWHR